MADIWKHPFILTGGPTGPTAPLGPGSPLDPCGPDGPVAPAAPFSPCQYIHNQTMHHHCLVLVVIKARAALGNALLIVKMGI